MSPSIRKYDARRISDLGGHAMPRASWGAQGSDLRRFRQLDELACGGVEGLLVPEHPFGARSRLSEVAVYDVNGNRQHGGQELR